jgi:hypothetical protein
VEKIHEISWNQEAFANLVLPDNRKEQLKSLVEAHTRDIGFDDFIPEKGQGLGKKLSCFGDFKLTNHKVINLFGNPGVGKTR